MQNTFLVTLLSYLFISCGSQVKVSTDHDELAYFNLLKNYKWYESGKPSAEISTLSHRRLHSAINRELALEGYKIVEKLDQADFFVNYAVAKKDKQQLRYDPPVYEGYSPYYYGRPLYPSYVNAGSVRTVDYTEGTLIIDILSAKTNKLIWRGVGTRRIPSKLNAEKRKEIIDEIVNEILSNFPPDPNDKPKIKK